MIKYTRIAMLLIVDMLVINFSYIAAFLLRFEFNLNNPEYIKYFNVFISNIPFITIIQILALAIFGIYISMWKYAGSEELVKIGLGAITGCPLIISYMSLTEQFMPRSIYLIACLLILLLVAASRMAYRFFRHLRTPGSFNSFILQVGKTSLFGKNVIRVMIVGAGNAGATMIKEIKQHPEYRKKVIVAIDDNHAKRGTRLSGVKVAGDRTKIKELTTTYGIDEIIVAIPSASHKVIKEILEECNKTKCKVKVLPGLIDLINDKVSISNLKDLDIEDLLGREPVILNTPEISSYIEQKVVMITGAGGSIGSELCRQIAKFHPSQIIALDIYENTIFELENEIKKNFPTLNFHTVICSICDKRGLEKNFEKYNPHVIFHAAAHKHVPLMESNPGEALINNILGTKNMLDLADNFSVNKFVMISTDKAVNPTNVMGATKRICEMMLQEKRKNSKTSYTAVRFGNVLGSNGSVIPLFKKQIAAGGPVTVTHKDITRYFMTIPEAVQLVIQTGAMAGGGEIFILDMGEPVKIMKLAENVIKLSGYVPYEDIDIVITGLRPGEKLFEELLLDEEGVKKTVHKKIYIGRPIQIERNAIEFFKAPDFKERISEIALQDPEKIKNWLTMIVPNYSPK